MTGWWVHDLWERSPVLLASWVFWILLSIMLHELAHGWAALWQGDDTPSVTGHMNFNPVTHMGVTSLLFFALLGFAWGQMPVSPWRFRMGRMGDVLVSAAGPAMNLALAAIALTALGVWEAKGGAAQPTHVNVGTFLSTGGWLNLFLAAFNMLPFPPLDGSSVFAGLVPPLRPLLESPGARQYGWLAIFACSYLGLFRPVMLACHALADAWSDRVYLWCS